MLNCTPPSRDVFSAGPLTPAAARIRQLISPEMIARVRAKGLNLQGINQEMVDKVKSLIDNGEAPTLLSAIRLAGGRVNESKLYIAEIRLLDEVSGLYARKVQSR